MELSLSLTLVEFWYGLTLSFFAFGAVRYMRKSEVEARKVPLSLRVAMIIFAALGVLGYASLYGNLRDQVAVPIVALVTGVVAGAWLSFQVVPGANK